MAMSSEPLPRGAGLLGLPGLNLVNQRPHGGRSIRALAVKHPVQLPGSVDANAAGAGVAGNGAGLRPAVDARRSKVGELFPEGSKRCPLSL
jgi:hypothetical protein